MSGLRLEKNAKVSWLAVTAGQRSLLFTDE